MAMQVYRCGHCGREVLVRLDEPPSAEEIARRVAEELSPAARGPRGSRSMSDRLREDIWSGISQTREFIPRNELPAACPACRRPELGAARRID